MSLTILTVDDSRTMREMLRLALAACLGLGNDEAYHYLFAVHPDWSYYDHPPLVAWTTWLLRQVFTDPWTVRLVPILCAAASGELLYRLGARFFSPTRSWPPGRD